VLINPPPLKSVYVARQRFGKNVPAAKNTRNDRRIVGRGSCLIDRLCGLVVRVPSYRSRGPGFDSRRYQIF
jgi:hypothetical protein